MANRPAAKRSIQNRVRRTLVPLILALFLVTLALWTTPAWADRWVTECADCPKYLDEMTDRSLRVDAAGHPHLAYGGDHLYYAFYFVGARDHVVYLPLTTKRR